MNDCFVRSGRDSQIGVLNSHFNKLCLFVELVRVRAYTLSPGIWTLLSDNYVAFFFPYFFTVI